MTETRALLERLERLRAEERRRIAEEIREGLMQSMSAVLLRLESAMGPSIDPTLSSELDAAADAVRVTLVRTRMLVSQLEDDEGAPNHGAERRRGDEHR